MKAKELRIGNYVNICYSTRKKIAKGVKLMQIENIHEKGVNIGATSFGDITVRAIYDYKEPPMGSNYDPENFLSPIPLDEEWLVKFGFEERDYYSDFTSNAEVKKGLSLRCQKGLYLVFFDGQMFFGSLEIKYIHQLQNLYYALTGEELTIKTK